VKEGVAFYKLIAPLIIDGSTKVYREGIAGYDHAHGWQCAVRRGNDRAMAVIHAFEKNGNAFTVPAELNGYRVAQSFLDRDCSVKLVNGNIEVNGTGEYFAGALLFERTRN